MPDPVVVPTRSREHLLILVGAFLAVLVLATVGMLLKPDPRGFGTHEQLGFQPCLPVRLWNVPCPGCGVTTAVALAFHGQPLASLRTQPFGLVTIACVFAFAVFALRTHRRGRDLFQELGTLPWRKLVPALTALLVVSWAYKLLVMRGWLG